MTTNIFLYIVSYIMIYTFMCNNKYLFLLYMLLYNKNKYLLLYIISYNKNTLSCMREIFIYHYIKKVYIMINKYCYYVLSYIIRTNIVIIQHCLV